MENSLKLSVLTGDYTNPSPCWQIHLPPRHGNSTIHKISVDYSVTSHLYSPLPANNSIHLAHNNVFWDKRLMTAPKPHHKLSAPELFTYCAQNDDPNAWREFVERFHHRIFHYVLRQQQSYGLSTNDMDTTKDLIQDLYLRLLANDRSALREFQGTTEYAVLAYLACIAHSVVSDYVRRQGRKKRAAAMISLDRNIMDDPDKDILANRLPAAGNTLPDEMMSERLTAERLRELLKEALDGTKSARDAIIFQLHTLDGLSAREIAQMPRFDMTEVSVMAVIRRTRERIRNLLDSSK